MADHDYQYLDDDDYVKVRSGYSRDEDCPTSDFIMGSRHDRNGHQHVVMNDSGEEIYNKYNENH